MIYLIGSLRNPQIPHIANRLREKGYDIYDDWYSPGPRTDEHWKEHQQRKGLSYKEALKGPHARTVFEFDKKYLDMSEGGILAMPAGKSGHLELGYLVGQGKPGFILMDEEPERWDIMLGFANCVCFSVEELIECLRRYRWVRIRV